ncbi:E3 ubiquitin-protein ligase SIRP1-like isoform X2 [Macadamia integrifolia]|nr:E3 ubiquitin-protein ligase SIRP1-like isoform X2 [Macadamia integrifolia]XP_042481702.1 E3 ubiquitin-protein ligase SIRP1-like isoform X2 [Macadamia integrifolia]XP_042481703.1 E3 ubiquitin-protein ligase SIRP1-like isoform X2 [Macadamia integrifolia]XP_042481704.1 E3 ubiquitin-protein ligase SIRP1-like isoform X2 [Macadamia integrifolia]XP_042481705.1 E3 ubiquitin-protein ligase SIRP1-like isoform X2 [Macadamia integrifolia]
MGEALDTRYWCHMCSQIVNPVMEAEIKCPFCESGFVEEMDSSREHDSDSDPGSDRALSLWAPILLGMMGGGLRGRRRFRREEEDDSRQGESEPERDFESILRRRRSSTAILQLLQSLQAGIASESDSSESSRERDRDNERVILINPFNQAVILQGSFDMSQSDSRSHSTPGSLGDYFIGPGLDLLLQHLADNDPNRYGTPPAKKDAVEALPTVKIEESIQCSVCLEDFEIGAEAKEMPCKHRFHNGCILPWLELHSSCPVCRFQMPADESKLDSDASGNNRDNEVESGGGNSDHGSDRSGGEGSEGGNGNGRRFWVPIPWPFNGLFSLSGSQSDANASSQSSSSSTGGSQSASRTDDN